MTTMYIHEGPGRWEGVDYDNAFWIIADDGREKWDLGPCNTREEAEAEMAALEETYRAMQGDN